MGVPGQQITQGTAGKTTKISERESMPYRGGFPNRDDGTLYRMYDLLNYLSGLLVLINGHSSSLCVTR
tara:strand:+ start:21205 stop:21408 length:204 start_codon:yes stop_codon:yes gene_type:complete